LSLRTDVLRLSAATLLGFVFVMRRSEARLVRQLRDGFTFYRLNPLDRWVLRRLVRNGVATLVDEGRYAFIPDGYASFRARRRVRAFVLMALFALALLIL
jgi:hypothetical protein